MENLFIVEILTRPDGPSYKRGLPKLKADAERIAASLEVAGVHTRVVPAEKYAPKQREAKGFIGVDPGPNGYRSRVE